MRLGEMKFPKDVSAIILDYARIWIIAPWVPDPINLRMSSHRFSTLGETRSLGFCNNPMAGDVFSDDDFTTVLYRNPAPWAIDICKNKFGGFVFTYLHEIVRNTNPEIINFIQSRREIYTQRFSGLLENPAAIDIIRDIFVKCPELYSDESKFSILKNPNAEPRDLPDCDYDIKIYFCAKNPAPWAIEFLQKYITHDTLQRHPEIFLNPHPWLISTTQEYLASGKKLYNMSWDFLSSNPSAIDILKAHPKNITTAIWENPGIFEPTIRPGISDILNDLTWPAS